MNIVRRQVNRVFPLYSTHDCKMMTVSLPAAPWDADAMPRAAAGVAQEGGCEHFPTAGSQAQETGSTGEKTGVRE